jgi:CDP-diacylglycerol--glycerol-3-phosphate 3-phosphatidyltransferase
MKMNLPNKLTIFRVILVPIFVVVGYLSIPGSLLGIESKFWIMNLIFIIASITDQLDGHIARKTNQVTTFGKFLDPLADKILVLSALVMLVEFGKIPAWIPAIVLTREFLVSGYRLLAVEKGGKVIAASMIAIILTFANPYNFGAFVNTSMSTGATVVNALATILILVSVVATIFSGWDYLRGGKDLFKD